MYKSSQRVLVNTVAQYLRTIVNMILSLYTVRVVLFVLGENDYGVYTLIAGIVAMLGFLTNSLASTTQRFLSYYQGWGDTERLKDVFANNLVIHLILGFFLFFVLESVSPFLFDTLLNIPKDRLDSAQIVFQFVLIMLFFSVISSPFRAMLVSHENIIYISIIDVVDAVLKVVVAYMLQSIQIDKLVFYSFMLLVIRVLNFVAFYIYDLFKYEECVFPRLRQLKKKYIAEMVSFASWSVYSSGCIIGRQQGVAIVLNKMMGTAVNAAYGIGFQVSGYIGFLSSSLVNAIAPQIVKSEGQGNRQRALWLSCVTCKFMFFLMSAVAIPCIFEIKSILCWWLFDVPDYAELFCVMVMTASMIDSLTVGLAHINQAIGNIKMYSIFINTPKLIVVPFSYVFLLYGYSLLFVVVMYLGVELLSSLLRIPFIRRTAGLNEKYFLRNVILKDFSSIIVNVIFCFVFIHTVPIFKYRFILTICLSMIVYGISIWMFGIEDKEKNIIKDVLKKMLYERICKKSVS